MDVSTRQLRAFIALAACRNFTQAAREIHISQPAFSAMIKSLEDTVGLKLFDRSTRHVTLTPAGEGFEAVARDTLERFDAQLSGLREKMHPASKVSVAAMVALTHHLLPPVFADFKRRFPQALVELHALLPAECLALVREGRVDFTMAAVGSGDRQGLVVERLFSEPYALVCRREHPLAAMDSVPLPLLAQYPFVHYSHNTLARSLVDAAMHPLRLQAVNEIEHIHTIRGLVEADAGISVAPRMTWPIFESPSLVLRPLAAPGIFRDICLAWPAGHTPTAQADALAQMIRAAVSAP